MISKEMGKVLDLVKHLESLSESTYFLKPLDFRALGLVDYPLVVRSPMDLYTIGNRIELGFYSTHSDALADLLLIIDNCRAYNLPGSDIVKQVEKFEMSMVKFCMENGIFLDNAMKISRFDEHPDTVKFEERVEVREKMKKIAAKKLALVVDVIETECPAAVFYLNDGSLQIRVDALGKNTFLRVKEMMMIGEEE